MRSDRPLLRSFLPWIALSGVLLLGLYLASMLMTPGQVGFFSDDAIYVTTARALADGLGYRYPFSPDLEPATRYPILFPAMLSAIASLVRDPWDQLLAMQWHSVAYFVIFLGLSGAFLIRKLSCPPWLAVAATALLALNPIALSLAGQVMSDVPFAAVSMLALWGAAWALERPSRRAWIAVGALMALACMLRYPGVILAAAMGLLLLFARRWRDAATLGSAYAVAMLPWGLWVWTHKAMEYGSNFLQMVGGLGMGGVWREVSRSAHYVMLKAIPGTYVPGWVPYSSSDVLVTQLHPAVLLGGYALSALTLLGLASGLLRPRDVTERLVGLYALLAMLLVVVWNMGYTYLGYWQAVRLLLPVLPFFVYFGYRAIERVMEVALPMRRVAALALMAVLLLGMGSASEALSKEREMLPEYAQRARAYSQAYAYIRTRLPEDAVIASLHAPMLYLYTGRRGKEIFLQPEWFREASKTAEWDYLFLSPLEYAGTDHARVFVSQLLERYPDFLHLAYANEKSGISIWKVAR